MSKKKILLSILICFVIGLAAHVLISAYEYSTGLGIFIAAIYLICSIFTTVIVWYEMEG